MNGLIDSRLAAQIVEQAKAVLPFDINVMDARGSVLASTDSSRVGSFHSGAQMVLGSTRDVEIESATAARIANVRPGVNLPLVVRGKLVGVIGLTGEPGEVRQFGKLLQSMAQLMLERDELTAELRREERHKEEFIRQVIEGTTLTQTELAGWAERLGIDSTLTRCAVLCRFTAEDVEQDGHLTEIEHLHTLMSRDYPELLLARISLNDLAIFGVVAPRSEDARRTEAMSRKYLQDLCCRIEAFTTRPFSLAVGVALPGIDGLRHSWTSALDTLRVALPRRTDANSTCFAYYDYRLSVLLSGLTAGWQSEEFSAPLRRLAESERDASLHMHTLKVWYAQSAHPVRTAHALGIHRNTLDYRLKKINEATGLDLSSIEDFVMMYIALHRNG